MKKFYTFPIFFALILFLGGCLNEDMQEPTVIIEPDPLILISADTIRSGSYMGFAIGEEADKIYNQVTALQASEGVSYLNVVGNVFDGLAGLEERMSLYQLIFLDEKRGTDGGVQLSLEDGRVKSIFLNGGKKLSQWPEKPRTLPAIRMGDEAEALYHKLEKISMDKAYKAKFERVSLLTKDLSKEYDDHMATSPQWYFAYMLEDKKMDQVMLNFKHGKLREILVNHYQGY